jgi:hypothetical protein
MKLQVPYGYNTFIIDNLLCVYTAKIRVKLAVKDTISEPLRAVLQKFTITKGKNDCTIISYAVTSSIENAQNIEMINAVLCEVMHKRINAKYSPKVKQYSDYNESIYCDLPF